MGPGGLIQFFQFFLEGKVVFLTERTEGQVTYNKMFTQQKKKKKKGSENLARALPLACMGSPNDWLGPAYCARTLLP